MISSILVAIIVATFTALILVLLLCTNSRSFIEMRIENIIKRKGKKAFLIFAEKKLQRNPNNILIHEALGDIYFEDKMWKEVLIHYEILRIINKNGKILDYQKYLTRMGIANFYLEDYATAINNLMLAYNKNPRNKEILYYLGYSFFKRGDFDKTVFCMKIILEDSSKDLKVIKLMGFALFYLHQYKDCLPYLKYVYSLDRKNSEILFDIAIAFNNCGSSTNALRIFRALRTDSKFGQNACFEAGKINQQKKAYSDAIEDYEMALDYENLPESFLIKVKYNLGECLIEEKEIAEALSNFNQVQLMMPGYKDVDLLILRYYEILKNKNYCDYLYSGMKDFLALCRVVLIYFNKDLYLKKENVRVFADFIEFEQILENKRWEEKYIFRFYRDQYIIGDVTIRDFYSEIKDMKYDAGFCVTMGSYSASCYKFCEGRPIDLIAKEQLEYILKDANIG